MMLVFPFLSPPWVLFCRMSDLWWFLSCRGNCMEFVVFSAEVCWRFLNWAEDFIEFWDPLRLVYTCPIVPVNWWPLLFIFTGSTAGKGLEWREYRKRNACSACGVRSMEWWRLWLGGRETRDLVWAWLTMDELPSGLRVLAWLPFRLAHFFVLPHGCSDISLLDPAKSFDSMTLYIMGKKFSVECCPRLQPIGWFYLFSFEVLLQQFLICTVFSLSMLGGY